MNIEYNQNENTPETSQVTRRKALMRVGKCALYAAPVMMLLANSRKAAASSGLVSPPNRG